MKTSKEELKNLLNIIKNLTGKTQADIAKGAGYAENSLTQILSKGGNLEPTINRIKIAYKDILNGSIITDNSTYVELRRNKKLTTQHQIPVYESSIVTLTNTEVYHDENAGVSPDYFLSIPQLRGCDYATRAKGDSMHPLIRSNSIVVSKELLNADDIIMGEIYIIHTRAGQETVKYVHQDEENKNNFLLVPFNKSSNKTSIPKKSILKIYEYRACLQFP